jgi:RimJ/RimL family protein N-acetyltransferase
MAVFLETARLSLRRLTPADAPLLCELDSDPEVMRHISKGVPTPLEQIENEILPRWLGFYEIYGGLGVWAAHEKSSDRFLGWFHLRPDRYVPDEQELGYRLRRDAWGRGYATEGALALLAHGFDAVGLAHVWAQTMAVNRASRAVMERIGLELEGTWVGEWNEPLPGWEQGEVAYGLTRQEWRARP